MEESCRLFFREEGNSGKTIVVIHGLFGSSDNWMTIGRKLSATNHVFMVDQRNHGRSPHCNTHSYETMKEDLARFFKEHQIDKASLIGHSMGGKVAMAFAADYPELVEKMVVVDIAPKNYLLAGENKQHRHIIKTLKNLSNNFDNYKSRGEIINFLSEQLNDPDIVMFLLKNIYHSKDNSQFACRLNLEVLDKSLECIVGDVNEYWFNSRLPVVNYPVLFIKGEKSPYITNSDIPSIYKIYPKAQITTIPNAGHWLHSEQPVLFLEILNGFIFC